MSEHPDVGRNKHILWCIGAKFAPIRAERQVDGTGARPSTPGCKKNPLQAVEKKKIIGVSIRLGNALFSAGNGLAKMGNTLGHCKRVA